MSWLFGWPIIFLLGPLFLVFLIVMMLVVYWMTGYSFLDFLTSLSGRGATLTCWHCGEETPADMKRCRHCGKELQ